jgi:hypothetical protein
VGLLIAGFWDLFCAANRGGILGLLIAGFGDFVFCDAVGTADQTAAEECPMADFVCCDAVGTGTQTAVEECLIADSGMPARMTRSDGSDCVCSAIIEEQQVPAA